MTVNTRTRLTYAHDGKHTHMTVNTRTRLTHMAVNTHTAYTHKIDHLLKIINIKMAFIEIRGKESDFVVPLDKVKYLKFDINKSEGYAVLEDKFSNFQPNIGGKAEYERLVELLVGRNDIRRKYDKLKKKYDKLKEHVELSPGGIEYLEAQKHFESVASCAAQDEAMCAAVCETKCAAECVALDETNSNTNKN